MEKENSLDFNEASALLRPVRIAFLIKDSTSLDWINDHFITWITSHWGQAYTFVFPISDQLQQATNFSHWQNLLIKFDPDQLISIDSFPEDFLVHLNSLLLTNEKPFQFAPGVIKPKMPQRGFSLSLPLEKMSFEPGFQFKLIDIDPTPSDLHKLWM